MGKILIVFYSTYGHVYSMAKAVKEGVDKVEGCEGLLYQVPETLPKEVLQKMHAPPKPDVPTITPDLLVDCDGIIFGFPTRYGMMAAQMKAFFDHTGGLWTSGQLTGKPCSFFVSTGTQGGGQETTIMTALTQSTHHGMIYVPIGYSAGNLMYGVDEPKGGSPWGAGCLAGPDGSRQPSETELAIAKHQGEYFAGKALKLSA